MSMLRNLRHLRHCWGFFFTWPPSLYLLFSASIAFGTGEMESLDARNSCRQNHNPKMTFAEIPYGSSAYQAECTLRHEVLRVPIGLSLHDEDLSNERDQLHFGLFDEDELVACVIAVVLSPNEAKIRQMAVSPEHQRKGCGRLIIEGLERNLAARGVTHFSMHARRSAVGFYEKLGYSTIGEEFTEVGLPHARMEKSLNAAQAFLEDVP
ncbi:MAG: hypothetical protein CFE26_08435 [Verrucomicrobiales bacterium VVV1]|nr:MAG: hypothetical protein CFE26_08435 [Verrucomicrobiales bacterium VVV1]